MWIAKVMSVTTDQEGNEQLYVVNYWGNKDLKETYKEAMEDCKREEVGFAAFYKDMTAEEIYYDDATKEGTRAEYQISKGTLGGIILHGKKHKKLCTIRENRKENRYEAE